VSSLTSSLLWGPYSYLILKIILTSRCCSRDGSSLVNFKTAKQGLQLHRLCLPPSRAVELRLLIVVMGVDYSSFSMGQTHGRTGSALELSLVTMTIYM
jgi:hypothetical protein